MFLKYIASKLVWIYNRIFSSSYSPEPSYMSPIQTKMEMETSNTNSRYDYNKYS